MKLLKPLLKVGAAGATIFAVGWGMLVLQPEPEAPIANADADIFASFGEKSQQQKFVHTLKLQGMEEPRAYDHNGNKLFFSTTTTNESPRQVLERFQRGFVESGLNEAVHLSTARGGIASVDELKADRALFEKHKQMSDARLAYANDFVGGVVPVLITDDNVVMTGATTKQRSDDIHEWAAEVASAREQNPAKKADLDLSMTIDAMRYVDAWRDGNRTRITAVWSDENYEAGKIADIGEDLNVDPEIPSCTGCKRLYHIAGETEKDYSVTAFDAGGNTVEQVMTYYDRSLQSRGWRLSETAAVIAAAEKQGLKQRTSEKMLQYTRGEADFLTVVAWPGSDGTTVHLSRSN